MERELGFMAWCKGVGTARAAAAALFMADVLSGCASQIAQMNDTQSQSAHLIADHVPTWANGEPADVPARPAQTAAYPSVFTTPPPHEEKLMTYDEEKREEAALTAARSGTVARVAAQAAAEKRRATEAAALAAAHEHMAVEQSGSSPN